MTSLVESAVPDRFYVISMEFLSLTRRRSSSRNVPSGEERETVILLFTSSSPCRKDQFAMSYVFFGTEARGTRKWSLSFNLAEVNVKND